MLRTGYYTTENGERVHVTATDTGYVVRYDDGTTTSVRRES